MIRTATTCILLAALLAASALGACSGATRIAHHFADGTDAVSGIAS